MNSAVRAIFLFAALSAMCSAGCSRVSESSTSAGSANGAWTLPGVARVEIQSEPATLDPLLARDVPEVDVEGAIFDGLVKVDDRSQLVPDLALEVPSRANGGIAADGVTITYHLRRGVRWQDGAPLTSADVAFTYRMLIQAGINSPYTGFYRSYVRSVKTPDPYTVIVRLAKPYAPAIGRLFVGTTDGLIVPEHLLAHTADINQDAFNTHPVGSGPFELARWDHGSQIVLKPFAGYFGGAPHLHEIDIDVVLNQNTVVAMLESHELDVAGVIPAQYATVRKLDGFDTHLVLSTTLRLLTFNLQRQPFDDPIVRRALTLALDRSRITAATSNGIAYPASSLIPPNDWAYSPDSGAMKFNPRLARAMLDADGWVAGSDGVRTKNGRRLSFSVVTYLGTSADHGLPEVLQSAWRAVGAEASIRYVPIIVMYGEPGIAADGKFDVSLDGFNFDIDPDRANYFEARFDRPNGGNQARYDDPDVFAWSEAALGIYDQDVRKAYYVRIAQRVNRDVPYVPLHWQRFVYVVNTSLKGFKAEPVTSDFWNVQEWSN
ncbi:MAG TPA: ABC transporter substrate-binding protein [Candidatus Eremiobacteraceae bacterium]|nr:ABC transporter substrate-binding protein [Candidatus Eremiobacteraceae bacterium]